ncbi:MAG: GNAT family N-acetyltransferase [Alphaproteobacteria bacterium]|nr:GNAT family N-acetyltransferase [Alphaproteobacteria bacterium]
MRVRKLTGRDLDVLTDMVIEFERFLDGIDGKKRRHDQKRMAAKLKAAGFGRRPFFAGLIAEEKGEALGYLLHHDGYSTNFHCGTLFISDLFVRASSRRGGVGRALMERAMQVARARGCGRVEWTVWNINAPAIGFYVGLGAKPIDDELILGLQLPK